MEGLEYNRRLSLTEFDNLKIKSNETSDQPFTTKKNSRDKSPSSTFISKKVFVYTDLRNRSDIITKFRSGKFAPKRPVNAVKIMYELITVGTKVTDDDVNNVLDLKEKQSKRQNKAAGVVQMNDLENPGSVESTSSTAINKKKVKSQKKNVGKFYAQIEWPGGRKTITNKITINRDTGAPFSILDVLFGDFNDRNELGVQYNVINFMRGKPVKPFNKWISFASPPDNVASGRSQEYYTISNERVRITPLNFINDVTGSVVQNLKLKTKHYASKISMPKLKMKADVEAVNAVNSQENVAVINREVEVDDGEGSMELEPDSRVIRPLMSRGVAVMKYKRYGECPSWYSVGRSSASEIRATRYNSIDHIPAYAVSLLSSTCPSFLESNSDNILENFFQGKDLLEKYRPWYYFISKRFQAR